jgi:Fe-S cluster biogenesis protein NfuA
MEDKIKASLERVRGFLQADGGDLDLVSVVGKTVSVKLRGACGCCPHAMITLKDGVERVLRAEVDPEIVVERVS